MKIITKIICIVALMTSTAVAQDGMGTGTSQIDASSVSGAVVSNNGDPGSSLRFGDGSGNTTLTLNDPVISGPIYSVCPGQVRSYSCTSVPGATTYTWVAPSNATITAGQGTTNVDVTFGPGFFQGYLRVTASNATEHSHQVVITVYSASTTPGLIQGPDNGACGGNTYTYSIAPVVSATSYTWLAPTGAIITTPAASGNPLTTTATSVDITFPVGYDKGTLYVNSNSGCNSSIRRSKTVRSILAAPGLITGLENGLCDVPNIAYSVDPVSGATGYTWTISPSTGTTIHGNGTNNITIDFDGTFHGASLCVTADNVCGHGHGRCKRLYAHPERPAVPDGPIGSCNNNAALSIAYYSVDPVFNANYYQWTVPAGATLVIGQGTTDITVDFFGSSSGNVTCRASNSCGASSTILKAVTVNACRLSNGEVSEMQLSAYPNPAKDNLTISFTASANEMYSIQLVDMTGRLVMNQSSTSTSGINKQELNLQNISSGLYNLVVKRGEVTERLRVVVE